MTTTIRVLMAERGLRPGEVWPAADISRARWYRIMNDPKSLTVDELGGIARALDVDPAELAGWSAAA